MAEIFEAALAKTRQANPPAPSAEPAAAAAAKPADAPKPAPGIFGRKPEVAKPADPPKAAELAADALPEELPADTPEPTKVNWKKAREVERKLRGELTSLQTQMETLRKAAPADQAEMERLKAEHKTLSDRMAVVDLQNHPDFTRQYVQPRQQAIATAKEVLAYNGKESINPESFLDLPLKDFNAKVAEATKDLNSMDATTVQTSLRTAYTTQQAGRTALAKAGELGQQLVQNDAAKGKRAFEQVWSELNQAAELFQPVEADEDASDTEKQQIVARNQAAASLRSAVERNIFGRVDHLEAARLGAKAAVADLFLGHEVPRIAAAYNRLAARNQALEVELAGIKKSRSPGVAVGSPGAAAKGGKGMSNEDIFTQAMGR